MLHSRASSSRAVKYDASQSSRLFHERQALARRFAIFVDVLDRLKFVNDAWLVGGFKV
jgi:hypothetical protein